MTRRALQLGTVALLLLTAGAATTGGWAVVTVTDLPEYVTVGEPFRIEYTVRQHGATVLADLAGSVVAASGERETKGPLTSANGRYAAVLTVPTTGAWAISINSGFLASNVKLDPIIAIVPGAQAPPSSTPSERGRHLFVAKGCGTCHVYPGVANSGLVPVGPEITPGRLAADYIARVLADPTTAVIPPGASFAMPKLELKPAEITALVAFLTGPSRQVAAGRF